jgi:hypothetical protein
VVCTVIIFLNGKAKGIKIPKGTDCQKKRSAAAKSPRNYVDIPTA